ncbi:ABC-F family ATP-binding cassette domain-containing protein [Sphingomonas immobilis]|uniref:ABC-F family ATP-binding cassette domain-containing protein n=1 Tax=Sphingomonas immobilis TaxID=3063997 RepID=A0ABT8ZTK8_9SPHN|nr:ABC-F family ATP-binding cassette domain-containing protein [Sphingomonas sp. CA1-15]MDO7840901.1 ABC-F family ATP-binding cassette domain-containing protein [Sphingomonas sp. CA1-15]
MSALLTLTDLSAATPDGRTLFSGLTLSVGARDRIGVVGRNGSGKSSLLAIVAGVAAPATGHVARTGRIGTLAQDWPEILSIAEALGIQAVRAATARIEAGEGSEADFAAADWTLEARVAEALAETGLAALDLDRRIATLSGGERTRVGLARLLIEAPDLILLDEPTNNLDAAGRTAVAAMLARWRGAAIVVSHDRTLLEGVDRIVELRAIGVRQVGGGWSAFAAERDAERARAEAERDAAARAAKTADRAAQDRREAKARRDKAGRAYAASGSAPKILLGRQAERAENTAGRDDRLAERQAEAAGDRLAAARAEVEIVTPLTIDLMPTGLPANSELLAMDAATLALGDRILGPWSLSIRGPERIAITGPNGAGKSTLLRLALGTLAPSSGSVRRAEGRLAMLDQHVGLLDPAATILDTFRRLHPGLDANAAHAALARFAFRNRDADRIVATLSGGERLRAGLACVLGGPQPARLLLLDEPTNHLDIASIEVLEAALTRYDGALLVVSHDRRFLEAIGIEREVKV